MALLSANQIKTVKGTSPLSLKADSGESFLVKNIMVYSDSGTFLTAKIEKTTVGFFRINKTYGNHLSFPATRDTASALSFYLPQNLLSLCSSKGIFTGFPVAEGETFTISGAEGTNDIKTVIYDIYAAEDQKNTNPNGSKSNEYFLLNYGHTGASIDATGDFLLDTPLNPVEFPAFPFGDDVPPKTQIILHGIAASEAAVINATPALAIYSTYLKPIKQREVLFDEDRNGILFDFSNASGTAGTKIAGGSSLIGAFSHIDPRLPLLFDEPLIFSEGDELNLYYSAVEAVDGSSISIDYQVVCLIETVKRITS